MPALTLQIPAPVKGRLPALDELKGLAILLVVLYHAGGVLTWNNYLHGDLGVDIFVILSGIGLSYGSHWEGAGPFLRKRLARIIPTYWLLLTVFLVLNSHFLQLSYTPANMALHYLGIHGWFGDAYAMTIVDSFWFITLILSLYLLYAGLHGLVDRPDRLLLAGALISVAAAFVWFLTGQAGSFGHLGLRLPGFFYGLLIGRFLQTGTLSLSLGSCLMLAALLLTYVPYVRGIVFHTGIVALGVMGFYVFSARARLTGLTGTRVRQTLKFLGDHSLEIFLLHQPLIRDYNVYLHGRWLGESAPSRLSLVMGMLAGFTITLLLSYELRRTLRRFFTS
ncbi:MAG: acyltransferase family protein [Verrucomicrobiota bacterium]